MPVFKVRITKTVITDISVEAKNADEARKTIAAYGLIEAASDYPVLNEEVTAKHEVKGRVKS